MYIEDDYNVAWSLLRPKISDAGGFAAPPKMAPDTTEHLPLKFGIMLFWFNTLI